MNNIDISSVFKDKIKKNRARYTIERSKDKINIFE
jgi:hypothetical protein